jgi:allophanate hydrolase subunit 1
MNNITVVLRHPQEMAWDAIEQLQRWWEESEALEPQSRLMTIPVIYGGEDGPDLANVARHSGLTESRWSNCTPPSSTWCGFLVSSRDFLISADCRSV